jgi:prepilin-type N-terminal cleavage/methylation domain-containing protein/prepilin-type processing-associated H-X9-DG protein
MKKAPPSNPAHEAPGRGARAGFTLVELLVVIAIIAILSALLFPAFAEARRSGHRAACISNLHQLSAGLMLYSDDNDQVLPVCNQSAASMPFQQPHRWEGPPGSTPQLPDVLRAYVKSEGVFHCPALDHAVKRDSNGFILPNGSGSYGYRCADLQDTDGNVGRTAMNGQGTTSVGGALWGGLCGVAPITSAGWSACGLHTAQITTPSEDFLIFCESMGRHQGIDDPAVLGGRVIGGSTMVMADGHVAYVKLDSSSVIQFTCRQLAR